MWIGYIASILITIAYVPQAWRCYKNRRRGISIYTLSILIAAMWCWIGYAISIGATPLLLSSVISLVQLLFLLMYPYVKNFRR